MISAKEIEEFFERPRLYLAFFSILFYISPGVLCLFLYYRSIFLKIATIKLFLLSFSFLTPVFFVTFCLFVFLFYALSDNANKKEEGEVKNDVGFIFVGSILISAFISAFIINLILFFSYVMHERLLWAICAILIVHFVGWIILMIFIHKNIPRSQKKIQK